MWKYHYKLIQNEIDSKWKVIDKDGFAFGDATNVKGAILGALAVGVRMNDIDFNGNYVPIKEIVRASR